ncbi:Panacea domain-containing protein [Saccharomonospora iraqiensis]|uniref:Panacea domain-containing protein n=1 Tax=Saccharomonospora iraqiensis TaxID=52698 RepID=UPI000406354D|nr:type II toxin-antitoxin system antitoxin SocA domain-containing protein [Saccharomonospora iraqiensis]
MATVLDVASYILAKHGPMTAMKLQKLCYYSYGYHLVWEERPLFPERFEAWANGPVCPQLYQQHRGLFQLPPDALGGNPGRLDDGERESLDLVLDGLSHMTAHQLSEMTHRELPWQRARARSGADDLDRSNEPLTDADIAEFFEALVTADGQ